MRRRNGTKKANDRSKLLLLLVGCVLLTVILSRWLLGQPAVSGTPGEETQAAAAEAGAAVGEVEEQVEAWIPNILAAEISPEFGTGPLRAQAVIARSLLYWLLNHEADVEDGMAVLSEEWLAARGVSWKTDEEIGDSLAVFQKAAEATEGRVMTCGGSVILPLYHVCSAGQTRDGSGQFAYLEPKESATDLLVSGSLRVLWLAPEDFAYALSQATGETVSAAELGLGGAEGGVQAEIDSAGYVERVVISAGEGEETKEADGDAFAGELGLPSAHYEWEDCSGQIRLTCRGIGHGYGLSQWGAQALYEQGYGWEEILTYYFSGVEITKPE